MGYKTEYFKLPELVSPKLLIARGERAWELLNPKILITIDLIRKKFGGTIINGTFGGKAFTQSGLREFDSDTGAQFSMHKFGGAMDLKFRDATPIEVFEYILTHSDEFPLLTCMEDAHKTKTWLHVDVRNHFQKDRIWVISP